MSGVAWLVQGHRAGGVAGIQTQGPQEHSSKPHTPLSAHSALLTLFSSLGHFLKQVLASLRDHPPYLASWFPMAHCCLHSLGPIRCPLLLPGHWWPPITECSRHCPIHFRIWHCLPLLFVQNPLLLWFQWHHPLLFFLVAFWTSLSKEPPFFYMMLKHCCFSFCVLSSPSFPLAPWVSLWTTYVIPYEELVSDLFLQLTCLTYTLHRAFSCPPVLGTSNLSCPKQFRISFYEPPPFFLSGILYLTHWRITRSVIQIRNFYY